MKQKLFTLLTLLLCAVSTTWAETVDDLTTITSATTITANTLNGTDPLADATLYADGKVLCVGGCGYSEKGDVTYNNTKYTPVYQIKSNRQLVLKIGFDASITVVGSTNSSRAWRIGTSSAGDEIASGGNNANFATGTIDGSSDTKTIYINASSDLYLAAIIITANSSTDPVINASSSISIKATESGTEVTEDINVTGKNLKGNTLTATFNPSVTGLSVTLGSSTISAGSLSTTATLHYTQTVNARGSTTLTLSDGTTTKDITVNYKATVVPSELEPISARTTFDLSKVGTSGMEPITLDDGYVVLSDAGSDVSFADNIAVSCIPNVGVTWRNDAVQAPLFKFKTRVPGTVTLKFSDVGSSSGRAHRYAAVNDVLTNVYSTTSASSGVVTCSPIPVKAGEVIIKGQVEGDNNSYTDNQIRVYEIVFTPTPEPNAPTTEGDVTYLTTTTNMAGWRAFYDADNSYSVDENTTVYVAASEPENGTISLTSIPGIPAGVPVILHTTSSADSYKMTLTKATVDGYNDANKLQYTTSAVNNVYRLGYGDNGVGFYPYSGTPASGAVILNVSSANEGGAKALTFSFSDVTGISNAAAAEAANAGTGKMYNLSGQIVGEGYKGIVIVNGKKVIK